MKKFFVSFMLAAFALSSLPNDGLAQSRRPGSSGSSKSSSGSSAKPTPSAPKPSVRPSSSPPSAPPPSNSTPTPSQRPSSPPANSPSVRPNSDNKQNSTPANPPASPSANNSVNPNQKPQSDSNTPAPSVRPGSGSSAPPSANNSIKPSNSNYNSAAVANKKSDESKAQFVKANAPKSDFKTPTGQTVKIDPNSESTKRVRDLPPEQIDPVRRREVVEKHYYHYYGSRYDYYRSQPPIYVGYYRPEFWWSTYDWDTHRQALWLYNNQSLISSDLWNQRMQNAALRAEIDRMRMQNMTQNTNYVDPEFASDPVAMYSDQYVDAAYNGQPVTVSSGFGKWLCITMSSMIVIGILLYLVFVHQWTKE